MATAAPPRPGATIVYDVMMPDGTTQSFPTLAEARAAAGTTGRILARAVPAPVP